MGKKIGIDARLWNETGVGRYIRNLVAELQKIDKENQYVLFALPKDVREIQFSISSSQFSIIPTDIPWHGVKEQVKFPIILEKENVDLVHFPYFSVPIFYKGKFVLTIHDLILHQFPTGKASTKSAFVYWLKHNAYKYVISQAAKKAEKIITVSEATKQEIISRLKIPQEKISVTYEGVDEKISNIQYPISNIQYPYFLYVGNAYPHKNLERLVEAFGQFCRGPAAPSDIQLVLVGKEDFFYKRLEKKVRGMGLGGQIIFKHAVSDKELANLYKKALALVQPSLMEGFGLPVVEAMAQRCLVACSDIPVFHEIAQNAAIYFDPSNVQNIQNVLESIAKGIPDEKERKQKGKALVQGFSWEKMAKETLRVYKSCLGV